MSYMKMGKYEPLDRDDDISDDSEVRIILVGKTGVGKSASGNTILGREAFQAERSPKSVTQQCKKEALNLAGRRITVVDTPGILGSMTEDETSAQIKDCVYMTVPGPHAFLLVLSLGRFTEEEQSAVRWIQKYFGEEASNYTFILFTEADQLKGKTLNNYLSESEELLQLIKICGGRFLAFNNDDMGNRTQVMQLLSRIDKMVEMNGGGCYTSEMFKKAQAEIKRKKRMDKIKDVALGVGSAVGTAGVVAGGMLIGVTEAVMVGAVIVGGGAALATGAGVKLICDKVKTIRPTSSEYSSPRSNQ